MADMFDAFASCDVAPVSPISFALMIIMSRASAPIPTIARIIFIVVSISIAPLRFPVISITYVSVLCSTSSMLLTLLSRNPLLMASRNIMTPAIMISESSILKTLSSSIDPFFLFCMIYNISKSISTNPCLF